MLPWHPSLPPRHRHPCLRRQPRCVETLPSGPPRPAAHGRGGLGAPLPPHPACRSSVSAARGPQRPDESSAPVLPAKHLHRDTRVGRPRHWLPSLPLRPPGGLVPPLKSREQKQPHSRFCQAGARALRGPGGTECPPPDLCPQGRVCRLHCAAFQNRAGPPATGVLLPPHTISGLWRNIHQPLDSS